MFILEWKKLQSCKMLSAMKNQTPGLAVTFLHPNNLRLLSRSLIYMRTYFSFWKQKTVVDLDILLKSYNISL